MGVARVLCGCGKVACGSARVGGVGHGWCEGWNKMFVDVTSLQ